MVPALFAWSGRRASWAPGLEAIAELHSYTAMTHAGNEARHLCQRHSRAVKRSTCALRRTTFLALQSQRVSSSIAEDREQHDRNQSVQNAHKAGSKQAPEHMEPQKRRATPTGAVTSEQSSAIAAAHQQPRELALTAAGSCSARAPDVIARSSDMRARMGMALYR